MPQLGTLAAALDFLPLWWQEATDGTAFDSTFAGWVRACGWKVAGFTWPLEGPPSISKVSPTNADRKSTRLNSSHLRLSRMPSSA